VFEFLFHYPAEVWQGARLSFASAWPWWLIGLAFGLGLLCIAVSLMRLPLSIARRSIVGVIQAVLLGTGLAMLLQPTLLHDELRRDDNVIAVVLDTSQSMRFAESASGTESRFEAATAGFESIADELSETFDTRLFSIGENLSELDLTLPPETFSARTDLAGGLTELLEQASAGELAAVVVLSDGGNNASRMDVDWWSRVRQADVPIHTVGVGPTVVDGDVEIANIAMPELFAPKAQIKARVQIRHPADLPSVRLRVKQGDKLRFADDVQLIAGALETTHEIEFDSGDEGIQALSFSVQTTAAESNVINNSATRVLKVVDAPQRILYIEGEPRWEYKFLRRAIDAEPSVDVVSLLRTSPNKFYRQGVVDARELETGFPLTREALFGYDALIIGSVDAAELSLEQQANVRDFVAERGGALLMLAGRSGLADGGWGRSAVQAALPVALDASVNRAGFETFERRRERVELTDFGRKAPWLELPAPGDTSNFDGEGTAVAANASDAAWASLPELADLQTLGEARAGAQVLIQTEGGAEPVLIWQRYGKGRSYILATSGTWRWQMSLPSEDRRHEMFWRNLLTELTADVPHRLRIDRGPAIQRDQTSTPISVTALTQDHSAYIADELIATVTRPDGSTDVITLIPDINKPGQFNAALEYSSMGPHSLSIALTDADDALEVNVHQGSGKAESYWMVQEGTAEYFATGLQQPVLSRIASETGGGYRALKDIASLPGEILLRNNALTRQSELPLWNMPFLFLLLVLGKALEWLLRLRWKRL